MIDPRQASGEDPDREPDTLIARTELNPVPLPEVPGAGHSPLPSPELSDGGHSPVSYSGQPVGSPPVFISAKSPAVHLVVSLFLPGVGSLMSGRTGIGVTILLLYILAVVLDVTVIGAIVGIPLGIGVWIWGMVDAYVGAQNWNRSHGIVS